MAEYSFSQNEYKLSEIEKILICLSQPQDKVERALKELCCILTSGASSDSDDDTRYLCFSMSIVKALLGILRSSSQVSMLVLACRCIALLTHDNDDGRIRLGELGVIRVLISLLHFHLEQRKKLRAKDDGRANGRVDSVWTKDWVSVYELVLICLRKLTFHNMSNQQELAQVGGIKIVVALAMDKGLTSNFGEFTLEAKKCMESLSLQKKFFSRVSPVPNDEKCDVLRAFPALCTNTGPAMYYPAFYVDLVTKGGVMVTHSLLEKGVVWSAPDDTPDSFQWTCLIVESVEDGNSLWCQFCLKNPSQAILDMTATLNTLEAPDTDKEMGQVTAPVVGESYISYFTAPPSSVPDPVITDKVPYDQWFRVRVLRTVSCDLTLVLAIDFGFTVTLSSRLLCPLPDQCRGIPPQAVPCRLRGIVPVPSSVAILENSAAVIRNMSFEKLAFCKEIQNFKGIEAMIKLAQCPVKEVSLQALGALVNLMIAEPLKEDIGKKGAIKVALDMVRCCSDGDVLQWAIGVLLNGLTDCKANSSLIRELNGEIVLREVKLDNIPVTQSGDLQRWIKDILSILSSYDANVLLNI